MVEWIWDEIRDLKYSTALDAFGGTGVISHLLKRHCKAVTYNDIMKSNYYLGLATIENDSVKLTQDDIEHIFTKHNSNYPDFIQATFHDIYYTDDENEWLDIVVTNIQDLNNKYKKALAFYSLFQACIIKRPFNLFHRKNLYVRTANVERSFGNKTTWDKPFDYYFKKFANEVNSSIFSNGKTNLATNHDALKYPNSNYDLVYIDTPYISPKGVGVNYLDFYHFLEGLCLYENWGDLIDHKYKHKKFKKVDNPWSNKHKIYDAFNELFCKFKDSILVVSYRTPGIPSEQELKDLLLSYKDSVNIKQREYNYVLSKKDTKNGEILLIGY